MHFTNEELNALGIIVSNAPIKGGDAKMVAVILDKIAAELQSRANPAPVPADTAN